MLWLWGGGCNDPLNIMEEIVMKLVDIMEEKMW